MNCLVTGGAGFIGSHTVDKLLEIGYNVIVIDNLSTGKMENVNPKATLIREDIVNFEHICDYFEGIDWVFHTAALARIVPSFNDPVSYLETNVIGTINCLLASKKYNVKKFVFSASSSCYSPDVSLPTSETDKIHPISPYGLQKYESELYCRLFFEQYGSPTISLRYFNVYGPRSFNENNPFSAYTSVVGIFLNQKKKGKTLTITGDGTQRRDFIFVGDVVAANIRAARSNIDKYEVFNVGYGKNYSVNEIAEIIGGRKKYISLRPGEVKENLADITKIKKLLGWRPETNLKNGIRICEEHMSDR